MSDTKPAQRVYFNVSAWRQDIRDLLSWGLKHRWQILIALGLLVRLVGYLKNREFWLDEGSLLGNVLDKPVFEVWAPLGAEQVAPPFYLMILRILSAIFGEIRLILRMPSIICGFLAFLLFSQYCKKHLPELAGLCSTALFALNGDLIYYSSEMKPYAIDVLVTVVAVRVYSQIVHQSQCRNHQLESLFLALSPWVSITSVFIVTAMILSLAARRDLENTIHRSSHRLLALFLASFLVAYAMEKSQVVGNSGLWKFWSFAFLKWHSPLESLALVLDNLINPMHLMASRQNLLFMSLWAILVLFVLCIGMLEIHRADRSLSIFIVITALMMAMVSSLRLYPLHGRTILFLVPFVLLVFSTGLARLAQVPNRYWRIGLGLMLLTPLVGFLSTSPTAGGRPMLYDGDLQTDYFTHRFGLMSKNNP